MLRDFVEPWLAALESQGRKPTALRGYRTSLDAYVHVVAGVAELLRPPTAEVLVELEPHATSTYLAVLNRAP